MINLICSGSIRPGYGIFFARGESVSISLPALLRNSYMKTLVSGKVLVAPENFDNVRAQLRDQKRLAKD